jgi:hypothetical protein
MARHCQGRSSVGPRVGEEDVESGWTKRLGKPAANEKL